MNPSITLRRENQSFEARVSEYMKPFQTATCKEHLIGALHQFPRSQTFPSEESGIRERVALRLLQEVIVMGAQEQEALDACLDTCGPLEALSACATTLQDISERNNNSKKKKKKKKKTSTSTPNVDSPSILETALRTIRRWLVKGVSFPPDSDPEDGYDERCWVEQVSISLAQQTTHYNTNSNGNSHLDNTLTADFNNNPLMEACLENLTKLVLLFPVQIANACHSLGVQLPTWAIASRYNPRLIEGALSMALYQEEYLNDDETCSSTGYFQKLVQRMVRNRSPDDVALGLYKYHERHFRKGNSNLHQQQQQTPPTQPKALCQLLLQLHRHTLTPRESAYLLRSIMISSIPRQSHATEIATTQLTEIWQKHLYPYIELSCRPILVASRKVREAFVRLLVLSPSSVLSEEWPDRLLCHCVASLLANPMPQKKKANPKNDNKTRSTVSDDDSESSSSESSSSETSDSSCSSDEESEESSSDEDENDSESPQSEETNHHAWLTKHVQEVVSTWSLAVFVRQTDYRLQRHVTNFLLSGLCYLQLQYERADGTGASPQPPGMSDLVSSLLEGVTVRLESSIPNIRKDGMMVAERLAQKMGQELQFDELNHEGTDEDEDDEVTFLNSVMTASEFPTKQYTKPSRESKTPHTKSRRQRSQQTQTEIEQRKQEVTPPERQHKSKKSKKKREKEDRRRRRKLKREGKSDTRILDAVYGHMNKKSSRKHRSAQSYQDSYDVGQEQTYGESEITEEPLPPQEQLRRLAQKQKPQPQKQRQTSQPHYYRQHEHQSFTDSYDQSTEQVESLVSQELEEETPQYRQPGQIQVGSLKQNHHYQMNQRPCPHEDQPQHQGQEQQHVTFANADDVIPEPPEDEYALQRKYWQQQLKEQRRQQQYLQQQAVQKQMDKQRRREQEMNSSEQRKREEQVTLKILSPNSSSCASKESEQPPELPQSTPRGHENRGSTEGQGVRPPSRHHRESPKKPDFSIGVVEEASDGEELYEGSDFEGEEAMEGYETGDYYDDDEQEDDEGIAACWTQHEVEMVLEDHLPGSPRRRTLNPRKAGSPRKAGNNLGQGVKTKKHDRPQETSSPRHARNSQKHAVPRTPSEEFKRPNGHEHAKSSRSASSPRREDNDITSSTEPLCGKEQKAVPSLIFAMLQDGENGGGQNQAMEQTERNESERFRDGHSRLSQEKLKKGTEEKEAGSLTELAVNRLQRGPTSPSSISGMPTLMEAASRKKENKKQRKSPSTTFRPHSGPPKLKPHSMQSTRPRNHPSVSYRSHPHVDPAEIDARILAAAYDQESDASTGTEPSLSVYDSSSSEYSDGLEEADGSQRAIRQSKQPFSRAYDHMKRKKQMRRDRASQQQEEEVVAERFHSPIIFDGRTPNKPNRRVVMVDPDATYVSDEEDDAFDDDEDYDEDYDDNDARSRSSSGDDDYSEEDYSDEDAYDDDDSVWEDSRQIHLDAYDVDDDEEDLHDTPRPLYLRDSLELLRAPESDDHAYSKHESALKWLPHIIHGEERPADLPDLAVPLALELMRMENKFNIEDFEKQKIVATIALAVEEPLAVGQRLIMMLWEDLGLNDRLNVLTVLTEAAFELSGNKQLEDWQREAAENKEKIKAGTYGKRQYVKENYSLLSCKDASTLTGTDMGSIVSAHAERTLGKVESKTRRWGRGRRRQETHTFRSRFGPVANVWYYSLVGGFLQRKDNVALWGGAVGARLLANMFVTLATIVECAGVAPGTDVLAKDLFELVWSFRSVDVAEVRMGVLVAVAASLACLSEEVVLTMMFDGSLSSLPDGLKQMSQSDPDSNCRRLAQSMSKGISGIVDSFQTVGKVSNLSIHSDKRR